MTEQQQNIIKTLATLDADLTAAGWNRAARLYQLVDDIEDPTPHLIGELPSYPPADLLAGYDRGSRVPEEVHGLVVSHEGLRHLTIEEVLERHAEIGDQIKTKLAEAGVELGEVKEGEVNEAVRTFYYEQIVPTLPTPDKMPPAMRYQTRITGAVMRDGTVFKYASDGETIIDKVDGREIMPSVLYQFLHGVRPIETTDPITAVSDLKTLEALSALPTSEG